MLFRFRPILQRCLRPGRLLRDRSMLRRFSSTQLFLRQFRTQFQWTGAVLPSSRFLAHELTRFLRQRAVPTARPLRILEVGAGTGSVTQLACAAMIPCDQLDIVEINPAFAAHLERRFATESALRSVSARTRILCHDVRELNAAGQYDVIISGLPFNNFPSADVRSVLQLYEALLAADGRCSFFEYIAIRSMKAWATPLPKRERQRLLEVESAIRQFLKHEIRRSPVLCNVLPAWVHHVRNGRIASRQSSALLCEAVPATAVAERGPQVSA